MEQILSHLVTKDILIALSLFIFGFLIAHQISRLTGSVVKKRLSTQQTRLVKRLVYYLLLVLFILSALKQIHVDLSILLGAAGIFSVAVGFASQTTFANFISGLFLILEKPIQTGDRIKSNSLSGEVLSIDMLSTKLRSANGTLLRIPNESLLKNPLENFSYFGEYRVDITVGIDYASDIEQALETLREIAKKNDLIHESPAPRAISTDFGDSQITLQLSAWCHSGDKLKVKDQLIQTVQKNFAEFDINIPFPIVELRKQKQRPPAH